MLEVFRDPGSVAVCIPSLSVLDNTPELVVLSVPGDAVAEVVDEALALGTRGSLAINAAVPDQERLAERIRAAGARLIGPNSLGLFDATTKLQLAWGQFSPGPLAIVSQSGQIGTEIAAHAARAGVGVSRFVSVGNQAVAGRRAAVSHAGSIIADARRMIERLRCVELLRGWRGRPAVDQEAIAEAVVQVSQLIAARPDLDELEFNPVRVGPDGLIAVDMLAVLA